MELLAQMRKQRRFWFASISALVLIILYVWSSGHFHRWFHPTVEWEKLPPLPNNEKALALTDVLPRNRINVLTEQGNYYSCPYITMEKCWIPIPREVNSPKCNNPGVNLPKIPSDTRQVGCEYQPFNDSETEILMAIVRKDGQVYIWTAIYALYITRLSHTISDLCCGAFSLIVGIVIASIVREAQYDLRIMKS